MKKIKLLLVEDEVVLGNIVKESLETRDFEVTYCTDGEKGWQAFQRERPDICVFDIMMPTKDGFSLTKEVRLIDPIIPIIFLTAKSQLQDLIKGFELGANDYIKKPFSMEELIVRIKSLLKHQKTVQRIQPQTQWALGQFNFDSTKQLLTHHQIEKRLTHRESEILQLLCENQNKVLERKAVLLKLWGDDSFFNARSMDVFITKLRKYLKLDTSIEIVNIRGIGYKLIVQ